MLRRLFRSPEHYSAELMPAEQRVKITPLAYEEKQGDPAYSPQVQFFNVGQPRSRPRNYETFVREGYKKNPTVYRAINLIARTAAGIRWRAYKDASLKQEIEKHPLLDLWNKPNYKRARTRFVKDAFIYWQISGNCYIYANRPSKNAPPQELWLLRPDLVTVVPGGNNEIQEYRFGKNVNNAIRYAPEDILHLTFTNPDDDFYGLSPMEVGGQIIDQQNEGSSWNLALMENSGRPSGAFIYKELQRLEKIMQTEMNIDRRFRGKNNAGRPLILDGDVQYIEMGKTPSDMDWGKLREMNMRDLAALNDIGPELVGDAAGKTFANLHEALQSLYTEKVLPMLDEFQDELNLWLPPMYGDGIYLAYDRNDIEALQENRQEATTRAKDGWINGILTFNEARKLMNLDEIPGGDVVKWGAAFVPADQLQEYAEQAMLARMAGLQNAVLGAQTPVPNPAQNDMPAQQNEAPGSQAQAPKPPTSGGQGNNGTSARGSGNSGNNSATPDHSDNAQSAGKVVEDEEEEIELKAWQEQRDQEIEDQLDDYSTQGVTHLRWVCDGAPCKECLQNDGQLVEAGDPFPSGDLMPPVHRNCKCEVVEYSIGERGKSKQPLQIAHSTPQSNRQLYQEFIRRYV